MSEYPVRHCDKCGWSPMDPGQHKDACDGKLIYMSNVMKSNKTEVRTTSVTGGQKGVKPEKMSLVPVGPLMHLARHSAKGAAKYAPHQWRKGIAWSDLYDAAQRHFTTWWDGVDLDTCPSTGEGCAFVTIEGEPFEGVPGVSCYNHTGSHHLDAVMWMAFALRDGVDNHPELDDRYKVRNPCVGTECNN